MKPLLILALMAAPVVAKPVWADCPQAQTYDTELQGLIAQAQAAKTFTDGQALGTEMWKVWLRAPDELAQTALDAGMRRREVADYVGAIKEFDRLAAYCPTYAEGFNQRAFVNFLSGNYEKALVDLDRAIVLQPFHIAAQAGRALTLMNMGRMEEAREQMLIAVENNPWLSEKALLAKGAPLGPKGEDI